jgi:hypothetical protein
MPRDVSEKSSMADLLVRGIFAEVVARHMLMQNPSLVGAVIADLRTEVGDVLGGLKLRTRDPKAAKFAAHLPGALDSVVKDIEALKPKV